MKKSQLRNIIRTILKEQNQQGPCWFITGDVCNGYGNWSSTNSMNVGHSSLAQGSGYPASGHYGPVSISFPNSQWSGVNPPTVGGYFSAGNAPNNYVFRISYVQDLGNSGCLNPLIPNSWILTHHSGAPGGGGYCSSYWKCQTNGNCTKHGVSTNPGVNSWYPPNATFSTIGSNGNWGSEESCNANCTPTPWSTNCTSNIPNVNCIKNLTGQFSGQVGGCMTDFYYDDSNNTLIVKVCSDSNAGSKSIKITKDGSNILTGNITSNNDIIINPIQPGTYKATLKFLDLASPNTDTHTVCLKNNPNGSGFISTDGSCSSGTTNVGLGVSFDQDLDRFIPEPTDPNIGFSQEPEKGEKVTRMQELVRKLIRKVIKEHLNHNLPGGPPTTAHVGVKGTICKSNVPQFQVGDTIDVQNLPGLGNYGFTKPNNQIFTQNDIGGSFKVTLNNGSIHFKLNDLTLPAHLLNSQIKELEIGSCPISQYNPGDIAVHTGIDTGDPIKPNLTPTLGISDYTIHTAEPCTYCCATEDYDGIINHASIYSPIPPDCKCQPGEIKINCNTFIPIP